MVRKASHNSEASTFETGAPERPVVAAHVVNLVFNGLYGFDPEVWAGMPVRTTTPGSYEVIHGYAMDDFAKSKIAATNKELVEERAMVAEMIA